MNILADDLKFPEGPAFDPTGALWCVEVKAGNLVRYSDRQLERFPTGGALHRIVEGFYFPNGLAFLDDGQMLVIAETYRQRLWRGAWDAVASRWLNPQPWAQHPDGKLGPDGMALGRDGLMWVAVYGSGQIQAVNAAGQIARRIELPGRNPTNCAFDPAGQLGLVVTEAERGRLLGVPELAGGAPLYDGGNAWP